MLDNIIVKVPNKFDLRTYAKQLINENVWLLKEVRDYLAHMNPDLMNDDEIINLLKKYCLLPEYLYFFKRTDSSFNEKSIGFDYKKMPEFFTNVRDAFLINNEVEFIVMEHFNLQILTLYDKNWKNQLGDCTDIEHGTDGNILVRSIGSCFWDSYKFIDNELTSIDGYEPGDIPKNSKSVSRLKVEIYHPDKRENPKLILKEEEPYVANNKRRFADVSNNDEYLDLPF